MSLATTILVVNNSFLIQIFYFFPTVLRVDVVARHYTATVWCPRQLLTCLAAEESHRAECNLDRTFVENPSVALPLSWYVAQYRTSHVRTYYPVS